MRREDHPGDLTSEARRRPLSREEEACLTALFEECPEERTIYRAGLAFDRDSSAREGDEMLVARLASRAARRYGAPVSVPPGRRRRPLVLLVAAAVVAAGTAAAGSGVVYMMRSEPHESEAAGSGKRVVEPVATVTPRRARPAPAVLSAEPVVAAAPEAAKLEPAPAPVPVVTGATPPAKRAISESSAAALFGEANKKRLLGDTAGAVAAYTQVAERFPASAESNLAELSLGKLFLASGQSERALAYFRRAGASGGALGSEALWGQAGALRALGRTGDERAALERLLALYPSGAYAKAARKRLGTDAP
ncbi:MAG TPA: tetratricopeptide repeat protein [Polyangiaceae bacterium]